MHNLLSKYFEKKKIDVVNLTTEEKETFDSWESILAPGDLTVEKIAEFCGQQEKLIKAQLKNLDNSTEKNERLILLMTVWSAVQDLINAPDRERESMELFLQQLIDTE